MSLVLSIVTIIYEFGVLPFAAGILLGSGDEEEISIHRMYIKGYCLLFTIFLFMAVPVIFTVNKLSVLVFIWKIFLIVTLPVLFLLYYKRKKRIRIVIKRFYENIQYAKKKSGISILFMIMIFMISVTFSMPSQKDDTPEIVNISIETDTMYQYQPYTQIPYDGINRDKAVSPAEMLYAVTGMITGLDSLTIIHVAIPFFFIPFFYAVCWLAGRYFFRDRIERVGLFALFVVIFYTAGLSRETMLAVGILNNSWNGVALAVACGVPLVCIQMFHMLDYFIENGNVTADQIIKMVFMASALQLMISKGYFVTLVILMCGVIILIYKKGLQNAGFVRKRDK
ncbi:hypothetical protein DWX81_09430 [Roseburia inulinivorans]|uniref:Uncharacterized protein n=1 Tax=Roseburia inulinivorans TaxID=360807 RepID=A0A3R5WVN3_9FIRM|nr:DUF6077 domain-containing protein [Roseburia inulinivorans]RGS66755.1 hypothetical protein DWX81_09430 [Roseburia inulinivorans]RHF00068.1 hypothetical protein DW707_02365 [Roseburia inulinivorans]